MQKIINLNGKSFNCPADGFDEGFLTEQLKSLLKIV